MEGANGQKDALKKRLVAEWLAHRTAPERANNHVRV